MQKISFGTLSSWKERKTFTTIEPLLVWNDLDNICNFVAGKIRRGANTKNLQII